jgi:pyrroloquinoline quinone biosynthesis protein B
MMADRGEFTQGLTFADRTVTAVILGNMQDGGLPHIGCRCERCLAALHEPDKTEWVTCLGLVDTRASTNSAATVHLFDATPDIKYQLNLLAKALGPNPERPERLRQPDGIFLTHAHLGHVGGLPQLGPEAMSVTRLPVYASSELGFLLQSTPIWQPLLENLRIVPLQPGQYVDVALDVRVTAVPVPHRDEWSVGTYAYRIQGPNRSLLYMPDIDSWDEWPKAEEMLRSVDVALVDASFYSLDEINGRLDIPHPLIPDTLARFSELDCQLVLTHLNHTNPMLDENSQERRLVREAGAEVAQTGRMFTL